MTIRNDGSADMEDLVTISMPVEPDANDLLSRDPLALLIAMLLDQQVPLERAFSAPYDLARRLGHEPAAPELATCDPEALAAVFAERPALHRYPKSMAARVQALCQLIVARYDGDARRVWNDAADGTDLRKRVAELPGFGAQKAQIFVALLGKQLGVQPGLAGGGRGVRCGGDVLLGRRHPRRGLAGPRPRLQAAAQGGRQERGQGRGQDGIRQPGHKVTERGEAMPLFGKNPADTGASWEPQAADSRLAQTAGAEPGGVFTSDLSVSEYVLLGEAGFEPLGFVVGSSIYHVGLQMGRWSQNQELQVLSQAMYSARELAMSRMRAESDHLGADGIVGVELRMQMYAWGQDVLEFVATGTAVKAIGGTGAHRAPDGRAFTSDLSAQDFFRLLAAGAVPVAFVLGTCVYHIAHQSAMQALRQAGQNQEMVQFTQGVYDARELALSRMQAEATEAKASGIVGVNVAVSNHVWGEHATEFLATGTAIRRLADEHRLPATSPKPTFTLGLDV